MLGRTVGCLMMVVGTLGCWTLAAAEDNAATEQIPAALQAIGVSDEAVVPELTAREVRGKAGFLPDFLQPNAIGRDGWFPSFLGSTDRGGFFPDFVLPGAEGRGSLPPVWDSRPKGSGLMPNFLVPRESVFGYQPNFLSRPR